MAQLLMCLKTPANVTRAPLSIAGFSIVLKKSDWLMLNVMNSTPIQCFAFLSTVSIYATLEGSLHFQALQVAYWWKDKIQQIQWLREKWQQAFRVTRSVEALNCNCWLWKTDDTEESLKNKPLRRCTMLHSWTRLRCNSTIAKAITLRARGNYGCLVINTKNIGKGHDSLWSIYDQSSEAAESWRNLPESKLTSASSPCLRTSSTAAMSSSFRSWLSLAICSPFSKKFWVACSTDTAKTWAFLERPFFLLDGPLLLVLTRVVTWRKK